MASFEQITALHDAAVQAAVNNNAPNARLVLADAWEEEGRRDIAEIWRDDPAIGAGAAPFKTYTEEELTAIARCTDPADRFLFEAAVIALMRLLALPYPLGFVWHHNMPYTPPFTSDTLPREVLPVAWFPHMYDRLFLTYRTAAGPPALSVDGVDHPLRVGLLPRNPLCSVLLPNPPPPLRTTGQINAAGFYEVVRTVRKTWFTPNNQPKKGLGRHYSNYKRDQLVIALDRDTKVARAFFATACAAGWWFMNSDGNVVVCERPRALYFSEDGTRATAAWGHDDLDIGFGNAESRQIAPADGSQASFEAHRKHYNRRGWPQQ